MKISNHEPTQTNTNKRKITNNKLVSVREVRGNNYSFDDGSVYEGDLINGKPHGKGKYTWANGAVMEGDCVNDHFLTEGPQRNGGMRK